ncbi:MAG: hemerythrin domain-containing protein [Gammaproteobacteria bacterium]|jgi:hemerythrin-like domain-containing protein|nr:hemerythrin domain-containing protein [Gammaproteobacteria bacterium]HJP35181.1 hemerythrin domain-containing protein [Gammaproteobacteria bacterium]
MSAILDHIHQDHRNMSRLLDVLDKEVGDLAAGDDHDYALMSDVVSYFNHYPARFHHPYEDELFGWISGEQPVLAGLVEELRLEHASQAKLGREVSMFLKAIQAGHMVPRDKVVSRLTDYIKVQRRHIDKEEGKLLKGTEELLADHHMIEIPIPDRSELDPLFGDEIDIAFSALAEALER